MIDINRLPDYSHVTTENNSEDFSLQLKTVNNGIEVYLTANKAYPCMVYLRWNETAPRRVSVLGDAWERSYGNLQWSGICAEHFMPWYFLASYNEDNCAEIVGCGVEVLPNAMASWSYDSNGISLFLDVRCGGKGVILNGRELKVCTVITKHYRGISSFEAAKDFCRMMSPSPILPEKPVYGGNNWYYAYGKSSFEEIVSDAALQSKLSEGLENRPFMVVDDGWQINACAGPWTANKKYGDMKKVADTFKKMNVRPGIWVRFLNDKRRALPAEWRLNKKRLSHLNPFYNRLPLDPSHPDVLTFIANDVKKIVFDWGFELLKHDFSAYDMFGDWGVNRNKTITDDGWSFYDREKTSAEIVKQFYKTILDAANGKCLIMGCNCISHLLPGLAHINRIGDDTSGTDWERTRKMGVNTLAFRLCQNGSFYSADADCVGFIPNKIDWSLNKQWAELLAYSATPLFISCPNGGLNDEQLSFMKELYAHASEGNDELIPLDWENTSIPARYLINGKERLFNWYLDSENGD